jgi:hypothetical protein
MTSNKEVKKFADAKSVHYRFAKSILIIQLRKLNVALFV